MHRDSKEILIGIYRKPTFADLTIPAESIILSNTKSPPLYMNMLDRANKIHMSDDENTKELGIISTIARTNGYNIKALMKTYNKQKIGET
jgi:hypothetical protein